MSKTKNDYDDDGRKLWTDKELKELSRNLTTLIDTSEVSVQEWNVKSKDQKQRCKENRCIGNKQSCKGESQYVDVAGIK